MHIMSIQESPGFHNHPAVCEMNMKVVTNYMYLAFIWSRANSALFFHLFVFSSLLTLLEMTSGNQLLLKCEQRKKLQKEFIGCSKQLTVLQLIQEKKVSTDFFLLLFPSLVLLLYPFWRDDCTFVMFMGRCNLCEQLYHTRYRIQIRGGWNIMSNKRYNSFHRACEYLKIF